MSSFSLMNTTTLNGTSISNMLSLVQFTSVSNALNLVTNKNNVTEILNAIESVTNTFSNSTNLTLISNWLLESSNLQSLSTSLSEMQARSEDTWYDDTVQDFYDACMVGNLVAVIWCFVISFGMLSHWKHAWRKVRQGKFGKSHCYKGSWSTAFTFVGYRTGVLFYSFWLLLAFVFASYWRPLRDLWAYLFGLEDSYFQYDPDPVDTCSPSTSWCDRNVHTYDYEEFCTGNYSAPLYCVKDDIVKYPWFTVLILWIVDLVLVRFVLIDRVLTHKGLLRKGRMQGFILLIMSWILMFYYGLIGFASATIRLILCFAFSFLFSSRSDISLAGPLDEVFGGWTATVHVSNRDFNPIVLTAYTVFLELLRDAKGKKKKDVSIKPVTRRWNRLAQYARAVGSYAVFMKRSSKGIRKKRLRERGNEEEETKYSSSMVSNSKSSDVEKLRKEIERLRHQLDISERRNKQLVPISGKSSHHVGLPGPLSRYRRHHSRGNEPETLPIGARIENLEVQ